MANTTTPRTATVTSKTLTYNPFAGLLSVMSQKESKDIFDKKAEDITVQDFAVLEKALQAKKTLVDTKRDTKRIAATFSIGRQDRYIPTFDSSPLPVVPVVPAVPAVPAVPVAPVVPVAPFTAEKAVSFIRELNGAGKKLAPTPEDMRNIIEKYCTYDYSMSLGLNLFYSTWEAKKVLHPNAKKEVFYKRETAVELIVKYDPIKKWSAHVDAMRGCLTAAQEVCHQYIDGKIEKEQALLLLEGDLPDGMLGECFDRTVAREAVVYLEEKINKLGALFNNEVNIQHVNVDNVVMLKWYQRKVYYERAKGYKQERKVRKAA